MMEPLSEQILDDCNYFCREDKGTLIQSSQIASIPKQGLLVWNTIYAKRVFYTGTPSTDANPNASLRWAEKGKGTVPRKLGKARPKTVQKGDVTLTVIEDVLEGCTGFSASEPAHTPPSRGRHCHLKTESASFLPRGGSSYSHVRQQSPCATSLTLS